VAEWIARFMSNEGYVVCLGKRQSVVGNTAAIPMVRIDQRYWAGNGVNEDLTQLTRPDLNPRGFVDLPLGPT
jgi:hypothetical protein